jgi:hypothetical protein
MSNLFGTNPNQVPLNSMLGNLAFQDKAYVNVDKVGIGTTFVDSGTAGQILQVYGGGAFISGSVGIGSTNPTSALTVVGDGNFTGVVTASSFRGDGSQLTGLVPNTVSTSSTSATQYIGFLTTNSGTTTSVLVSSSLTYIPATNSLGIGTTNPTSRLTVVGDGNFTGVLTASSFRGDGSQLTGLVPNTVSTSSTSSAQYIGFLTTNSGTTTSVLASSSLTYIPATNSLGIGTTNPTSALTVVGGGNFSGVLTASSFRGDGSQLTGINVTGAISVSTNTTNQDQYLTYATSFGSTTGLGATAGLIFNPSTGNLSIGVGGTIITTTGIGSVGIGSALPGSTLVVNAPSGYTGYILDAKVGGGSKFQVDNAGAIYCPGTLQSSKLSTKTDGYEFYIGSTSAFQNDVFTFYLTSGTLNARGRFSINGDVILDRDAAGTFAQRNGTNAQTFRIYNTYTSGSQYERAYLGWNNNTFEIGVGTAGISTARSISLVGAAGSNTGDTLQPLQINQTWTAGSSGIATALTVNVTDTSSSSSSNLMDLRVGGTSQAIITKNGVIAQKMPGGYAGMYSPTGTYFTYFFGETGSLDATSIASKLVFGFGLIGGNGKIALKSGGSFAWSSSSSDPVSNPDVTLYRDAANTLALRGGSTGGNTGVGQTFRIYNTYTNTTTNFERANIGWSNNLFIVGTEKGSSIGTARQMEFQTDGTTRVAITTTGSVGIGSTQPTATLDVNGNTNISGVITASSFVGSGLNLTDVRIGISSGGSVLGTAGTINFTGSGISTITVSSGIATINIPATTRNTSSTVAYEGQTIFPCSYTIGYVEVYFNGSRLSSTQYEASDGANIILYESASANDIVETVGYNGVLKLSASKTILTDVSSDGLTFYTGKANVGIATTEAAWTIRRSLFSSAGIVTSVGIARDIAWSNRISGIYT